MTVVLPQRSDMSSPVPDMVNSSLMAGPDHTQGRGGGQHGHAERGGRFGIGRGGRDHQHGGRGRRAFGNASRRQKFRGSFQAMGGHVFELPEESNDRTQYNKTIDKLKEHVKTTYRETYVEIAGLFSDPMTQPTVKRPAPLKEDTTEDNKMIRNEKLKIYAKRMEALEQNLIAVHTIIWGQTSPAMQTKIKSVKDYETKFDSHDCLWLLRQVKAITMSYENKKNPMMSELEAKEQFYMCKQERNESPEDYMHKLKAWADVVEHCGGDIAGSWKNVPEEFGTQEEREKAALDYTLATAYIKGMDRTRYGVLSAELKNSYAKGQNDYPTT